MQDFVSCGKCDNGYVYNENYTKVTRCSCLTKFLYNKILELELKKAHIPLSVMDYSIDNYIGIQSFFEVEKIYSYVHKFKEKFSSICLYMYGPNGTQKTTLAQWIGRELIKKGISVFYTYMDTLLKKKMKEGWEYDSEILMYLRLIESVDCLILDESFDKDKITWYASDYQMSFLDNFLRNRIERQNKPIIFISNKEISSIKANFNNSIYDLIRRNMKNTVLYFQDSYTLQDDFNPKELWM